MKNNVGSIIRTIGWLIIVCGAIAGIIVWTSLGNSFDGSIGFIGALITFGSSFISGILFIGFSEVIFLLDRNGSAQFNEGAKTVTNENKSSVLFGEYNGKKIEWIKLRTDSQRTTLISKDVIAIGRFSSDKGIWKNSELRNWLNGEFLNNSFSDEERSLMITSTSFNEKNPIYNTVCDEEPTKEKVFILSVNAVNKYFPTEAQKVCLDTSSNKVGWWTRTIGKDTESVCVVNENGALNIGGINANTDCGIRPVIWVSKIF